MAGGKATPKKDEALKVSAGEQVKAGQIVCRAVNTYKAGKKVKGQGTLQAACAGKVYFTRKKTPHGRMRTFINVLPASEKTI